jgi:hypothetical protein
MNKIINVVLVAGFLLVDFLFFHDVLKAGEVTPVAQYLVGILSVVVIIRSLLSLLKNSGS